MDKRPELNTKISIKDFQEFYWLKEELVHFCRTEGLRRIGSKIELTTRIERYLLTGLKEAGIMKKVTPNSRFDWSKELLTLDTPITDNYKNTEHVRSFFLQHIGEKFKFNVQFMNWMKGHVGSKLSDAIVAWNTIKTQSKDNNSPKVIAPQFEYNQYISDFMRDNPNKNRSTAIALWKIKRSMRGNNIYKREDLNLIEN